MTSWWQQIQFVVALLVVLGAGAIVTADCSLGDDAPAAGAASANQAGVLTPGNEADEKLIRMTADRFVKAFNAGNAKAIGDLWAPDGEYTDESAESFQGRAAIEKVYADLFKEHRGATMTVTIDSIRFLGNDIALEKGVAQVKAAKQE
ncbi:MAG TPA: SgcJ/EcaC family oxidoreductase, partial [Pirellulales bacterium]|nr:SgcJ/EcaC family oxidoreductase [Pirellulales bacterium]